MLMAFTRTEKLTTAAYYDYLATALHFAAESSTGTNVNDCTAGDFTKSVDALVYYIEEEKWVMWSTVRSMFLTTSKRCLSSFACGSRHAVAAALGEQGLEACRASFLRWPPSGFKVASAVLRTPDLTACMKKPTMLACMARQSSFFFVHTMHA